MARIIPPDFNIPDQSGLHESERQTLEYLADALPDTYTVFSNVLWARSHAHNTQFGEIDFVVVSPAGQLIVIEQKSGGLTVRDGQILKRYGLVEKNAGQQLLRSVTALKAVWQRQHRGETLAIDYLLYLPDYRMNQMAGLQLDANRVVHAGSALSLAQTLESVCGEHPDAPAAVEALHAFLTGVLELELDLGHLQTHQERLYRRYEDTLLAWVNRLQFSPYVLRVDGCAGSGKTQLAIGLLQEGRNRGEAVRYICFNRPLADGLARSLGMADCIHTRDQFYDRFLKAQQVLFDYEDADPELFKRLEAMVERTAIPEDWKVDLLVIDEGQDIPGRSLSVLRQFLRPNGRLVWLEDPEQNLYGHEPVELPGAVILTLDQCFRSPQSILEYLTTLFPVRRQLSSANPFVGEPPEFHVATNDQVGDFLGERIEALLAKGAALQDIAIISLRSVRHSALQGASRVGRFALSTFSGSYSEDGEQVWTDGDVMFDSVYRFKGSQKPFILLVDVDASSITIDVVRRIYCGMTRATIAVELVMNPTFEAALRARFEPAPAEPPATTVEG